MFLVFTLQDLIPAHVEWAPSAAESGELCTARGPMTVVQGQLWMLSSVPSAATTTAAITATMSSLADRAEEWIHQAAVVAAAASGRATPLPDQACSVSAASTSSAAATAAAAIAVGHIHVSVRSDDDADAALSPAVCASAGASRGDAERQYVVHVWQPDSVTGQLTHVQTLKVFGPRGVVEPIAPTTAVIPSVPSLAREDAAAATLVLDRAGRDTGVVVWGSSYHANVFDCLKLLPPPETRSPASMDGTVAAAPLTVWRPRPLCDALLQAEDVVDIVGADNYFVLLTATGHVHTVSDASVTGHLGRGASSFSNFPKKFES
jgi:hypothetical protein